MTPKFLWLISGVLSSSLWLLSSAEDACAGTIGPITFASAADYDNTANTVTAGPTTNYNQTGGDFRDVIWWSINNNLPRLDSAGGGDFINRGNSLIKVANHAVPGSGPYTSLNFTGPSISGGQSYLSIYDTTPADGTATRDLFDATHGLTVSADVLFIKHNVSAGVVALYSEGQDGLALLATNTDGNNLDVPKLSLVWQSVGKGITLSSVTLPANSFVVGTWYQVAMDVTVAGDIWTMNGSIRNHLTGTDPTSGLGSLIWNLTFSGSLSDPDTSARILTNPGEVGIMAMGNESISLPDNVGVSVTNFTITTADLPEPASLAVWGILGLAGIACFRRRTTGAAPAV